LLAEPAIAEVLHRARTADIAMVGIGAAGVGSSEAIIHGLGLTAAERRAFLAAGPSATPAAGSSTQRANRFSGPFTTGSGDRTRSVAADPDGHRGGHRDREGARRPRRDRGELVDGLIIDASLALALLSEPRKK
jgi:hypothetical protein